ncbi:MAG: hypothetical protein J6U00_04905 [Ruminococcus sp.]|jgi:hypothetical protein|uniref:hypothetical protein n=1 Tax=Ruminococcus sp. TaxID=41978 RepID=UPI001B02BD0F|nr:hypothetical protein [Ruminococcus sp.]MBO7473333.1 hypothetical protein [Ruminococcus sp.]
MLIKGSRRYNLRHNSEKVEQPAFGKMINGQGLGFVSRLRYGICPMSFNGCEVIAVHNALVYLGKPQMIGDVAFYMERFRVLMGFFGCNAYSLGRALKHFGADCQRVKSTDGAKAFIITFWTKRPLFSMIHTVLCVREAGMIKVYNRYNNVGTVELCNSVEEVAGKYRPIAIYKIS